MPKRLQLMTPSGVQTWTVAPKRMRGDHGQTHFRTKRVEIDDSFPLAVVVDTVIHEAWHVATGCDGEHPDIERIAYNATRMLVALGLVNTEDE